MQENQLNRKSFNTSLILTAGIAEALDIALISLLPPIVDEAEVTFFTLFFAGAVFVVFLIGANICYSLARRFYPLVFKKEVPNSFLIKMRNFFIFIIALKPVMTALAYVMALISF